MGWSYSGEPGNSDLDAVRFEIPDTEEATPLLQDAEIEYAIQQEAGEEPTYAGLLNAAAHCCEKLSRQFALKPDVLIGSLGFTYSKGAEVFAKRAVELRAKAQGGEAPFAGGLTRSEKRTLRTNHNRVQPRFRRDQFSDRSYRGGLGPGGG